MNHNISIEETRHRIKDKLHKAKASGLLTEEDESLLLKYALEIIARRNK